MALQVSYDLNDLNDFPTLPCQHGPDPSTFARLQSMLKNGLLTIEEFCTVRMREGLQAMLMDGLLTDEEFSQQFNQEVANFKIAQQTKQDEAHVKT